MTTIMQTQQLYDMFHVSGGKTEKQRTKETKKYNVKWKPQFQMQITELGSRESLEPQYSQVRASY